MSEVFSYWLTLLLRTQGQQGGPLVSCGAHEQGKAWHWHQESQAVGALCSRAGLRTSCSRGCGPCCKECSARPSASPVRERAAVTGVRQDPIGVAAYGGRAGRSRRTAFASGSSEGAGACRARRTMAEDVTTSTAKIGKCLGAARLGAPLSRSKAATERMTIDEVLRSCVDAITQSG